MLSLNNHHCLKCGYGIYDSVYSYSQKKFGYGLCKKCQQWLKDDSPGISPEARVFFLALRKRKVNVEMEKHDGHKHIDLAITSHRINLEIDGGHHHHRASQALTDLKRTCHSLLKGYTTIRIPNVLVREKPEETADELVRLMKNQKKQNLF
jgi:very-short-patch-repair endonuclease